MRWTRLFADLEARLDHEAAQERAGLVAELVRAEAGQLTLADRLRALPGTAVSVRTCDGDATVGTVARIAAQWVLLTSPAGGREREVLVPLAAIDALTGLGPRATAPRDDVASRLTLAHVLRGLARDRAVVDVRTRSGAYAGVIERVGPDHLDLAPAPAWGEVSAPRDDRRITLPFAGILAVADGAPG